MLKSSLKIVEDFLHENDILVNVERYLRTHLVKSKSYHELPEDIVVKIIANAYDQNKALVKSISDYLIQKHELYFGRIQKEQLKRFIDYRFDYDLKLLTRLVHKNDRFNLDLSKEILKLVNNSSVRNDPSKYLENLKNAILEGKEKRVADYLLFLYSRLVSFNEKRKVSLYEIFERNERELKKEFEVLEYLELKKFCSCKKQIDNKKAFSKFNEKYTQLLGEKESDRVKSSLVYLLIDQKLFDRFEGEDCFFSYLINLIKKTYSKLQNHKTLAIKINNVISNGLNLKWRLYAYLTIYAEKFKQIEEKRSYYNPSEICADILEHKFKINLNENEKRILTNFYKKKLSVDYLRSCEKFSNKKVARTINYLKKINQGFSFIDCFILKTKIKQKNPSELDFIKNENELLLVFNKHEIDDRKIPCPVCAGLKVSGNSYSEIGIKSWECKNQTCPERSKTNRGKRYSARTVLMQNAAFDFSKENQISKELVKLWRKDVALYWDMKSLYSMLVKFFTFAGNKVTILNAENTKLFEEVVSKEGRIVSRLSIESFLDFSKENLKGFSEFFNSEFFDLFLYEQEKSKFKPLKLNKNDDKIKIIIGDSYQVLESIKMPINNMVTSPPYYNAREYSQWKNLFNYLNDMFNINLKAHDSLIEGGIFFYNIGDIFDNENIIKSKMGEKRIPLGAYAILIFEKAGFEILDNIIWHKGEPQSNRHKNDGNYTPYYQRPANCYEHMFIFRKKGKLKINQSREEIKIKKNIINFTPVFKIGRNGENKYGHTAPFPKMIPLLSVSTFTNKGDSVLDPFSGSGTTAIVANSKNRTGIGIEMNPDYALLSIDKAKEEKIKSNLIEFGRFIVH